MKLKFWQKSFLLTFAVFFVLLNVCLSMWCVFDMKDDFTAFTNECEKDAEYVMLLQEHLIDPIDAEEIEQIVDSYALQQTFFKFSKGEEVFVDTLPCNISDIYSVGIIHDEGASYYYMYLSKGKYKLQYMKSLSVLSKQQHWLIAKMMLLDAILAIVIGILLYYAMKRIYRPVTNISHELRTPLTSILGYSQLIGIDSVSDEIKKNASERIESNAKYMKNIIEQLLMLDSLKGNSIIKNSVSFDGIITDLKAIYQTVTFVDRIGNIECDEFMFRMLLSNLLSNAVRESNDVTCIARGRIISVTNTADITKDELKSLNGININNLSIKDNGLGVELCHEIAKVHGWRLVYTYADGKLSANIYL